MCEAMVTKKFCLSDKAVTDLSNNPIPNYYWEKDVCKAVRLLKEAYLRIEALERKMKVEIEEKEKWERVAEDRRQALIYNQSR